MRNRIRVAGVVAVLAGLAATGVAGAPTAGASVVSDVPVATSQAAALSWRVKLYELRTPAKRGWFYTASASERSNALRIGFTAENHYLGYMANKKVAGSLPVYRLHLKARSSYLLTQSATERNNLTASGKWVYDGVAGYTSRYAGSNKFRIYRASKEGSGWRVANLTLLRSLVKNYGYHYDGSLGFVWRDTTS